MYSGDLLIYIYIAGINATSQEVFSRTRGVEINLAIKYYCVLLCSPEAPARYNQSGEIISLVPRVPFNWLQISAGES